MSRRTAVLVPLAALLGSAIVAVPAVALTTRAPGAFGSPTVTVAAPTFVLGASLDAAPAPTPDDPCPGANATIPMTLSWTAEPGSLPLSGYTVEGYDGTSEPRTLTTQQTSSTRSSLPLTLSNYSSACGGQVYPFAYGVSASSASYPGQVGQDTATAWTTPVRVGVWQEDGSGYGGTGRSAVTGATRTGTWHTARCACSNWGGTLTTAQPGASTTYALTTGHAAQDVALVMPVGPDRGQVRVSLDGGAARTVDTASTRARSRVVVWRGSIPSAGRHSLTVTAVGTPGHGRVDVDSVLLAE